MPIVLFAENWDTIGGEGPRLWLCKKRPTECITVQKLGQEHHARHIGTVRPHAMHAEEKDRGIFKFGSQGADKPVDRLDKRCERPRQPPVMRNGYAEGAVRLFRAKELQGQNEIH